MRKLADAVVVLVALLHLLFLVLEMFLWNRPYGRRAFGLTREFAEQSAKLAANQGLYNGFLAAGLIWGLLRGGAEGIAIQIFFLVCVLIAGLYGGLTVKRSILVLQALPAALALALVLLAR
jgi:putative membrane protein